MCKIILHYLGGSGLKLQSTIVCVILGLCVGKTIAASVVAPSENATTPGGGSLGPFGQSGSRYLFVLNGSDFLSAMPEGSLITAVAFRLNESVTAPVQVVVPQLEVWMSTSPVTSQTATSRTFAENIGPDETVVFRGDARFASAASPVIPKPFDLAISLDNPFYYNPRNGSLSIDLRVPVRADEPVVIDASGGAATIAGALGSDFNNSKFLGAVVEVQFTTVPEPTTLVLLISGGGLILLLLTKERKYERSIFCDTR